MIAKKKLAWGHVLCALSLATFGCGGREVPELGYVSGTVTMDGKPMEGVDVNFHPQGEEGGRSATGRTDSEGKYELEYIDGIKGTKLGVNKVSIMTYWPEGAPADGEYETIPAIYNGPKSTLQETVVEGDNTFDFKLESE